MRLSKNLKNLLVAAYRRIDRVEHLSRRGSVLILVVALLVLLALIGTATLTSTRTERYTSVQHTNNTQIDLLMEGVKNIVQSLPSSDQRDSAAASTVKFHPSGSAATYGTDSTYDNWDWPDTFATDTNATFSNKNDAWLSQRVPVADATGPMWWSLGAPLLGNHYDTPVASVPNVLQFTKRLSDVTSQIRPDSMLVNGKVMPAFNINGVKYLAADTDGDGIADAAFVRLPVGELNGLTYFAAFRVIDNAGAINVNTALSRNYDFTGSGATVPSVAIGPSSIGLAELLNTAPPFLTNTAITGLPTNADNLGTEMQSVNEWRFHLATGAPLSASGANNGVWGVSGNTVQANPLDDADAIRNDFRFFSIGDALSTALGRRIDNPGYADNTNDRYRAFGTADSLALAYRYILKSPADSEIETRLPTSLAAPIVPYAASDVTNWYSNNFNYGPADTMPRRALLTGMNGVSNLIPVKLTAGNTLPTAAMLSYQDFAVAAANSYAPKTNINTASEAELWRAFWCVMAGEDPASPGHFGVAPYVTGTVVNPAPNANAEPDYSAAPYNAMYYGMDFQQPIPATLLAGTAGQARDNFEVADHQQPMRMFRSPIRDTRATVANAANTAQRMTSRQVVLMRSMFAALNAEQMRTPGAPINFRTVIIPADGTSPDYTVVAYPVARQPYITEVYANTDTVTNYGTAPNTTPYVAVEMFFPYNGTLSLNGWQLAQVTRDPAAGTAIKTITPITTAFGPADGFPGAPATAMATEGSYVLLENFDDAGAPTNGVNGRPTSSQLPNTGALPIPITGSPAIPNRTKIFVPNLAQIVTTPAAGQELMLFNGDPTNADSRPIDSFDFTGLVAGGPTAATVWHYVRKAGHAEGWNMANPYTTGTIVQEGGSCYVARQDVPAGGQEPATDVAGTTWFSVNRRPEGRCVYPGRYDGSLAERRQQGTQAGTWDPSIETDPLITMSDVNPGISLGAKGTEATSNDNAKSSFPQAFAIQVMNFDQPSPGGMGVPPASAAGAAPFTAPFGMFAREADMMHVPFFAAYRLYVGTTLPPAPGSLVEVNPLPMDAAFCEDTDPYDDPRESAPVAPAPYANAPTAFTYQWDTPSEQVGRFVPIDGTAPGQYGIPSGGTPPFVYYYDDFQRNNNGANFPADYYDPTALPAVQFSRWRYRWARSLYDYLTVNAPHDDYLPNVLPANWAGTPPTAVANGIDTANSTAELVAPVHGRININTAPWKVLAQIPWVRARDNAGAIIDRDGNGLDDNVDIALAIVRERDNLTAQNGTFANVASPGPFESIIDIYRINEVRSYTRQMMIAGDPATYEGDLSPAGGGDNVRGDYEEQMLIFNRVSNLITTRSDTFTAYVDLQGWRNIGTATATLEVERHAAFIIDRSSMTPTNSSMKILPVPTDR